MSRKTSLQRRNGGVGRARDATGSTAKSDPYPEGTHWPEVTLQRGRIALLAGLLTMLLGGCGGGASEGPGAAEGPTSAPDVAEGSTSAPNISTDKPLSDLRVAGIFAGVTTDADFNTLGLLALEGLEAQGAEIAFAEKTSGPDADRVMREFIDLGFNVIWLRVAPGEPGFELAKEFPEVTFIIEEEGRPEGVTDNVWTWQRNFHLPQYPIGVVAAELSRTGRIGYVAGPKLPFSFAEVRAIRQAIEDRELDVELTPVWAGDFNDPVKGQQVASEMFGDDIDVIISSLNLGVMGIFTAATAEPAGEAWVIAKFTDKLGFAPNHYVTSSLYDYPGQLLKIANRIADGESGAHVEFDFNNGIDLRFPLENLPEGEEGLGAEVQRLIDQIRAGEIKVVGDTSPLEE